MGESDGVADRLKRLQQFPKTDVAVTLGVSFAAEADDLIVQRAVSHESHRVERDLILRSQAELVNRHDVRMLQLPGDPGFPRKAFDGERIEQPFTAYLLDGHGPVECGILGDRNDSQSAAGMRSRQLVTP